MNWHTCIFRPLWNLRLWNRPSPHTRYRGSCSAFLLMRFFNWLSDFRPWHTLLESSRYSLHWSPSTYRSISDGVSQAQLYTWKQKQVAAGISGFQRSAKSSRQKGLISSKDLQMHSSRGSMRGSTSCYKGVFILRLGIKEVLDFGTGILFDPTKVSL